MCKLLKNSKAGALVKQGLCARFALFAYVQRVGVGTQRE
jgi:hypothetical protein